MADPKAGDKDKDGDKKPKRHMGFGPAPSESNPEEEALAELPELSLEELDQAIASEDPAFLKKVSGIAQDTSLTLEDIDLAKLDEALYQETLLWRNAKGWRFILYAVYPNIPKLSLRRKALAQQGRVKLKLWSENFRARWTLFLQEDLKKFRHFLIEKAKAAFTAGLTAIRGFWAHSLKVKMLAILFVALLATTVVLIFQMMGQDHQPEKEIDLYLRSFSDVASEVITYDSEVGVEPFYDNLRSAPNLIYLEKMVVNLKPGPESPNPMAAFELFLEGLSPEVVLEVKERETMIRDHIQRTVESYNFEDLDSPEGKRELMDSLARSISKKLISGKLKSVRIKTLILKP